MEKYIKLRIVGIFTLILSIGACSDQLLKPTPKSILTSKNAYNTAANINSAVLGIYSSLQSKIQSDYLLMELPSDNMYGEYYALHPGLLEIENLEVSVDNPILNSYWKQSYNAIYRANQVLSSIDNPTDYEVSQKEQYIGEAKFLRALYYFDLVRLFGDVPLILKKVSIEKAEQTKRALQKQVINQVIEDLKDAITKLPLPSNIDRGRASKAAAASLLGKVYVHLNNWEIANKYLKQVINDYNYSLVSNFGDLFSLETEDNSETIFSIPFVGGTNGQGLTRRFCPHPGILGKINAGQREVRPTYDLQKLYDDKDSRFQESIGTEYIPANGSPDDEPIYYPFISKYIVREPSNSSSGLDIPMIRLGGIILLYSEALYKTGHPEESLKQLNRIRERAFHDSSHNYLLSDFTDKKTFMDLLLKERRLELAFENQRWFDLVRTGRFVDTLTKFDEEYEGGGSSPVIVNLNPQPHMKYFPIPNVQIELGAPGVLNQNEGY